MHTAVRATISSHDWKRPATSKIHPPWSPNTSIEQKWGVDSLWFALRNLNNWLCQHKSAKCMSNFLSRPHSPQFSLRGNLSSLKSVPIYSLRAPEGFGRWQSLGYDWWCLSGRYTLTKTNSEFTLPESNMVPENRPSQQETHISTINLFRSYVCCRKCSPGISNSCQGACNDGPAVSLLLSANKKAEKMVQKSCTSW